VRLYQVRAPSLVWNFESKASPPVENDTPYFPFVFQEGNHVIPSQAGDETSAFVRNNKYVVFNDKYSLPAGVAVGISLLVLLLQYLNL